jgi:hypothetical protein
MDSKKKSTCHRGAGCARCVGVGGLWGARCKVSDQLPLARGHLVVGFFWGDPWAWEGDRVVCVDIHVVQHLFVQHVCRYFVWKKRRGVWALCRHFWRRARGPSVHIFTFVVWTCPSGSISLACWAGVVPRVMSNFVARYALQPAVAGAHRFVLFGFGAFPVVSIRQVSLTVYIAFH